MLEPKQIKLTLMREESRKSKIKYITMSNFHYFLSGEDD